MFRVRPLRVLVAQDDAAALELVRTRLALKGYDVSVARTGRQAIDAIHGVRPRILVLDLDLPGMDGLEVLKWMNRSRSIDQVAVLVLGANLQGESIRAALDLGAKDCLSRPFKDEVFLARFERLLIDKHKPPESDLSNDLLL